MKGRLVMKKVVVINSGVSNGKESAQSKKSRLLKKVREGVVDYRVALKMREVDEWLGKVMSVEDVMDAKEGKLVKRGGGGSGVIRLVIELEDEE